MDLFIILLLAIVAITLLDSIGSITSRKWNYNYGILTVFSIVIYTCIGYFAGLGHRLPQALLVSVIAAIFDATIGWKIALALDANFGRYKDQTVKSTNRARLTAAICFALIFGSIGHYLASR